MYEFLFSDRAQSLPYEMVEYIIKEYHKTMDEELDHRYMTVAHRESGVNEYQLHHALETAQEYANHWLKHATRARSVYIYQYTRNEPLVSDYIDKLSITSRGEVYRDEDEDEGDATLMAKSVDELEALYVQLGGRGIAHTTKKDLVGSIMMQQRLQNRRRHDDDDDDDDDE